MNTATIAADLRTAAEISNAWPFEEAKKLVARLKRKPKEGETVSLRLNFTKSEAITVEMPVKSATYQPTSGH